jgi:hypothetical protein
VLVVAALWARTAITWQLPASTDFYTFGYLFPEQRAAFDTLAGLTAPNGIVAASLNSGPIGLYANRTAVRPGYWSQAEWLSFVGHVMAEGRPVYILRDSTELDRPLQALTAQYHVVQIAWLPVPYFPQGDGPSINQPVALYVVGPSTNGTRIHEWHTSAFVYSWDIRGWPKHASRPRMGYEYTNVDRATMRVFVGHSWMAEGGDL